jgi:hypothetical protein
MGSVGRLAAMVIFISVPFFHFASAGEMTSSHPVGNSQTTAPTNYGKFLGCLNLAVPPVSMGALNLRTEDAKDPEEDHAIFYGKTQGKSGVLLITPTAATFDQVPIFKPEKWGFPEYPLVYKHPNGDETFYNFYVNEKTQRGDAAGILYGDSGVKNNPDTPFFSIGTPQSKISTEHGIEALIGEILARLDGITKAVELDKENAKLRPPFRMEPNYDMSAAKNALCACMKTGQTAIKAKVLDVASQIKVDKLESCDESLVARAYSFPFLLSSVASASERKPQSKMSKGLSLELSESANDLHFSGDELAVCTSSGQIDLDVPSMRITGRKQKCEFTTKADPICGSSKNLRESISGKIQDCSVSGKFVGAATTSSVFLLDLAHQRTQKIDASGGQRIALSARWIAWTNKKAVSIQELH